MPRPAHAQVEPVQEVKETTFQKFAKIALAFSVIVVIWINLFQSTPGCWADNVDEHRQIAGNLVNSK